MRRITYTGRDWNAAPLSDWQRERMEPAFDADRGEHPVLSLLLWLLIFGCAGVGMMFA